MGSGNAQTAQWVVFRLEDGRYALPLASVQRIVRAAEITPLPSAPEVVLGALDVGGEVLPVFDLRRRFGLPPRPVQPADQFLIARTSRRIVVLAIDDTQGVIACPADAVVEAQRLEPRLEHIRGILALEDGLVLIQDLEELLSPEESLALDRAMDREVRHVR